MSISPTEHDRRKELMKMFPQSGHRSYEVPVEQRKTWLESRSDGDLVRNVLQKGQSVADLLNAKVVPANTKEVKILAWKYNEAFDAFLIKRVNSICDVYHFYSSLLKLQVQDLKELVKLPLINSS